MNCIVLALLIAQSFSQPILHTTFNGPGCQNTQAIRIDVARDQELALFNNFQVGGETLSQSCQMNIELDLANRCLNNVEIANSLDNNLPPNARGQLSVISFIDQADQMPFVQDLFGEASPFVFNVKSTAVPAKKYCNEKVIFHVQTTIEALDPVSVKSINMIHQKVSFDAPLNSVSKALSPIGSPVSFSGMGCSNWDSSVNAQDWMVILGFRNFRASSSLSSNCYVDIPLNLFGGCLVGALVSTTFENKQDLQSNIGVIFNGQRVSWDQEYVASEGIYKTEKQLKKPHPAICGDKVSITLLTSLGVYGNGKESHGAITSQMFQVQSLGSANVYSGQASLKPAFLIILPAILALQ